MSDHKQTQRHDPDQVLAKLDMGLGELEKSVKELRDEVKNLRDKQLLGEPPSIESDQEGN